MEAAGAIVMWMLAFVFVASATAKFADIEHATAAVRSFLGTPGPLHYAGALLAAAELTLAVALAVAAGWIQDWRRPVATIAAIVLWVFAAGLLVNWLLGNHFSCGCFGTSSTALGPTAILRTAALAGVATWIATSIGTVHADPLSHALAAALLIVTAFGAGAMVTAVRSQPSPPTRDPLL